MGYAFGEKGEGPAFFAKAIVERSRHFHSCMARRAREGFAHGVWDKLGKGSQDAFSDASRRGPKDLLVTILSSNELRGSRTPR